MASSVDRYAARSAAFLLLVLGLLPWANWIPGGLSDPGYGQRWREWGYGLLVCAGAAALGAIAARRLVIGGRSLRDRGLAATEGWRHRATLVDALVAGGCGAVYALAAATVFDSRPLLIDEIVQVLQARIYATGRLFTVVDGAPEFFSVLHIVDAGGRYYAQFPPGWPAMLAIGALVRTEWLVAPACGAVAVFLFIRLVRRAHGLTPAWTGVIGGMLFGLAPFVAFQFASHMSHGPATMWLLAATLAFARAIDPEARAPRARPAWAAVAGLCTGFAFAVRPLDAAAFAVPGLLWAGLAARRLQAGAAVLVMAALGVAVPVLAVSLVNAATTGSPTTFGYEVLWGRAHGLGFHDAPWGDPHTPARALELLSLYVTRLNVYLLEAPFPALLLPVAGLVVVRSFSTIERVLLAGTVLHAVLYALYWHDGFYLGPRFVVPWVPALVLLTLRVVQQAGTVRSRAVSGALAGAGAAGLLLLLTVGVPVRVKQYESGLASMRTDYSREAEIASVANALVFVRESWGAQLIARLWALGVSRPAAAALYAKVDACELEMEISRLEERGMRGPIAEEALRPLLRDSLLVRASTVSPDTTERLRPGATYGPRCTAHVLRDREGYALYPPFLLDRRSGNIYARDFQERNEALVRQYPSRQAFVVSRDGVDGLAPLVWTKVHSPDNQAR